MLLMVYTPELPLLSSPTLRQINSHGPPAARELFRPVAIWKLIRALATYYLSVACPEII